MNFDLRFSQNQSSLDKNIHPKFFAFDTLIKTTICEGKGFSNNPQKKAPCRETRR